MEIRQIEQGKKIKLLRFLYDIPQEDIADLINVPRQTIIQLERNCTRLSPEDVGLISDFFECREDFLNCTPPSHDIAFITVPPVDPTLMNKSYRQYRRRIQNYKKEMHSMLMEFCRINNVDKYSIFTFKNIEDRIFLLQSTQYDMLIFIKVLGIEREIENQFDKFIKKNELILIKEVKLERRIDFPYFKFPREMFYPVDTRHRDAFIDLFQNHPEREHIQDKTVGFIENYIKNFGERARRVNDALRRSRIQRILEEMRRYNISPNEIIKNY
ncbi:MAG TPA: helix-turn-helix transcriptional regulator [Syntrophorhabdaceae bacterium]|nr:helix-turn-helix transcriptional regulator [Syntrophorhabdaceae bacterium]